MIASWPGKQPFGLRLLHDNLSRPHAEEHRSARRAQIFPELGCAAMRLEECGPSSSFETRAGPVEFAAPPQRRAPQDEDGRVAPSQFVAAMLASFASLMIAATSSR
jgi:hypothetical protein